MAENVADPQNQFAAETASGDERRGTHRHDYRANNSLAPYDGENFPSRDSFFHVKCYDLSTSGFSFLWPTKPDFKQVIVMLRRSTGAIAVSAEIVNCRPTSDGVNRYVIGCRFREKVEGGERL